MILQETDRAIVELNGNGKVIKTYKPGSEGTAYTEKAVARRLNGYGFYLPPDEFDGRRVISTFYGPDLYRVLGGTDRVEGYLRSVYSCLAQESRAGTALIGIPPFVNVTEHVHTILSLLGLPKWMIGHLYPTHNLIPVSYDPDPGNFLVDGGIVRIDIANTIYGPPLWGVAYFIFHLDGHNQRRIGANEANRLREKAVDLLFDERIREILVDDPKRFERELLRATLAVYSNFAYRRLRLDGISRRDPDLAAYCLNMLGRTLTSSDINEWFDV